ncbi:ATP-binding cassette domain-containing protein [bacterium]|nr:MAG: ATP-binding cassette domain-containing protein [bacterium]
MEPLRAILGEARSVSTPVLEAVGLHKRFGAVIACHDVSVAFDAGELVGVVGPNGAGKTTFVNVVTGYVAPDSGYIKYRGREHSGLTPRTAVTLGIARSFQHPQLYESLTVLENALIALAVKERRHASWRPLKQARALQGASALLERFELGEAADVEVGQLPEGRRKVLDIAMSFALRPSVLLLDEPTSGVSAAEKFALMDTVTGALAEAQMTVLFIEHDMEVVERYARRVLAFVEGRIIADGRSADVLGDARVRELVLGVAEGA